MDIGLEIQLDIRLDKVDIGLEIQLDIRLDIWVDTSIRCCGTLKSFLEPNKDSARISSIKYKYLHHPGPLGIPIKATYRIATTIHPAR